MRTERLTRHELTKRLGATYVEMIYNIEVCKFDDTDWKATSGNAVAFGATRLDAIQALFESDDELEVYFELELEDDE